MTRCRSDMALFSEGVFSPLGFEAKGIGLIADGASESLFRRKKDGMPRKMDVGLGAFAQTVYQSETLVYAAI